MIPPNVQFINSSALCNVHLLSMTIESGNNAFVIENDLLIARVCHKGIRNVSPSSAIQMSFPGYAQTISKSQVLPSEPIPHFLPNQFESLFHRPRECSKRHPQQSQDSFPKTAPSLTRMLGEWALTNVESETVVGEGEANPTKTSESTAPLQQYSFGLLEVCHCHCLVAIGSGRGRNLIMIEYSPESPIGRFSSVTDTASRSHKRS
jgi:hypothetical protein